MRVAVLGGGFQGACAALEIASRGVQVDLFDRNDELVTQAGARNEGKIHLGYVYAADRSFSTARTLMNGALAFAPVLRRLLGTDLDRVSVSTRYQYLVHKESMVEPERVKEHFQQVTSELSARCNSVRQDYFGVDLRVPHRDLTGAECRNAFDPEGIVTAVETQEISIDTLEMALLLRKAIAAVPGIRVWRAATVVGADRLETGVEVRFSTQREVAQERYDHVVNALWDGREAIDRSARLPAPARQLYRYKYGVRFAASGAALDVPSVTIVLGPFGDIVDFRNGSYYLSWYPACLRGISAGFAPESWKLEPEPAAALRVVNESFAALSGLVRGLAQVPRSAIEQAMVRGGIIVARGETDIVDPRSGLHRRHEIGVESHGAYHSIDTGKYTMAPLFAREVADRICGAG